MSASPIYDAEKGKYNDGHSSPARSEVSPTRTDTPLTDTVSERKLVYKIDRHVLPFICVMYLLAFLDRYVILLAFSV
jgi:hypothetical protein